MMKPLFILVSLLFLSSAAVAEQWEAKCIDNRNLHYLQTVNGPGYLYMTVTAPDSTERVFPFASVRQTFFNETSLCGEIIGGIRSSNNLPLTQFCANKMLGIIYIKYADPNDSHNIQSGKFCDAAIIER